MNILPKKRWHVKNKDNAARVEADKAKHSKKKNDEVLRSLLATQEARVDYLREKKHGSGSSGKSVITSQETLRLFADVEENRNLFAFNKEYEEELRQEKEAHEKKLGILKYVGETEDGMANAKPWWSEVPKREEEAESLKNLSKDDEVDLKRKQKSDPLYQMKKVEEEFERIREAKEAMAKKERAAAAQMMNQCSSLFPNDIKIPVVKRSREDESEMSAEAEASASEAKRRRLERLRVERLARERGERERAAAVLVRSLGLAPSATAAAAAREAEEAAAAVDERSRPFNSAFNPELSNLAAERRNAHRSEIQRRRRSFR